MKLTDIGERLYEAYVKNFPVDQALTLLKQAAHAFKTKAFRTFGRRFGKIPETINVKSEVDAENYRIKYTIFNGDKKIGEYTINNPETFYSENNISYELFFFHRFLNEIIQKEIEVQEVAH